MSSKNKTARAASSSHDNRVVISGLCKSLTSQMTSPERKTFDEAYRHALSHKASTHDLTLGTIPIMILISCIESGLNACQSVLDSPNPQPVGKYWNPTIAALLRALGQMAGVNQPSQATERKPKVTNKDSRPPRTVQARPSDSVSVTSSTKGSQKVASPSYASVTKHARAAVKEDSPPRSPAYQPDESPPKEQESLKQSVDTCAIRRELSEFLHGFKGPYIRHLKTGCSRAECTFCRDAVRNVTITKCIGHAPCHASGWYPHVGKLLWEILRRKHDKGLPFEPKKTPLQIKSDELEPLMYGITAVGTLDSPKRKAEPDATVDVKVQRVAPQPVTLLAEGNTDRTNWADDVSDYSESDTDSGDVVGS